MAIYKITLKTKPSEFYDITDEIQDIVEKSKIKNGICHIFCPGSTGAILLNENDPSLLVDIDKTLERIASSRFLYQHSDNAYSHIHASLIGSEKTIPIENGKLLLGTWQSILFRECDNKPRERKILISVLTG